MDYNPRENYHIEFEFIPVMTKIPLSKLSPQG